MPTSYNDASYITQKGNALIAKLLASRGELQFTRVSIGSGTLSGEQNPTDMTALNAEVMDGVIASLEHSGGEASVAVQFSSVGVQTGFYATELGLWANDPDEGEILHTFVLLQNQPEWMRPDSDAVNKLATFTIVTIVSSVSLVSAVISPAALATLKDLEKYAKLGHRHSVDDIDGLVELIEDLTSSSIPGGALFSADFTNLSNVKVADGYLNQSTKALEA